MISISEIYALFLHFQEKEVENVFKRQETNEQKLIYEQKSDIFNNFKISIEINVLAVILLVSALSSRFFKLDLPRNVV